MQAKFLFLLLIAVSFSCCYEQPTIINTVNNYDVINIDGCEYLNFGGYYKSNSVLTHKGNCSNSIHKCNCK